MSPKPKKVEASHVHLIDVGTNQITPQGAVKMEGSFLDLNFNDVYEPELFEADKEVLLRVSKASLEPKKNNKEGFNIAVVFCDPTNPKLVDVYQYISIPPKSLQESDPKSYNNQMLRVRDFCSALGLSPQFDVEQDLPGKECWAILRVEDDPQYGKRNSIKRFVTRR